MLTMNISAAIDTRKEKKRIRENARSIVYHLAEDIGERTIRKYDKLNEAREFIIDTFTENGGDPREETYFADGVEVANIVTEIKGSEQPDKIIVVGAHYDTVENTPGADDNASAVAGLLELHRLLSGGSYRKTVRFVAFTLEEPPYFSTELMGSMQYASGCRKRNDDIELMICLEMLGYASKKHVQEFPFESMKKQYPMRGDFITVISLPSVSQHVYLWKKMFNRYSKSEIFEVIGPASIPGMDLSDHTSFIKNGYPAVMITDTAFYRNKNYHTPWDTYDTLNYRFMAEVIMTSYRAIFDMLDLDELFS